MKNAAEYAKRLMSLLRALPAAKPPEMPGVDEDKPADPIGVLVASFLLWESTTDKARIAYRNLNSRIVDFNDLRVCMPQETLECIGVRYPRGLERCQRLRAALRDVYRREHAVCLDGIAAHGKREIRRYLDSLDGMVPYVAARLSLLCFEAHAIPVDEQLHAGLIAAGVADASVELSELESWLEHHIKATDAATTHFALQAWIDGGAGAHNGSRGAKSSTRRKRSSATKSSTKKPTTKRPVSRA